MEIVFPVWKLPHLNSQYGVDEIINMNSFQAANSIWVFLRLWGSICHSLVSCPATDKHNKGNGCSKRSSCESKSVFQGGINTLLITLESTSSQSLAFQKQTNNKGNKMSALSTTYTQQWGRTGISKSATVQRSEQQAMRKGLAMMAQLPPIIITPGCLLSTELLEHLSFTPLLLPVACESTSSSEWVK